MHDDDPRVRPGGCLAYVREEVSRRLATNTMDLLPLLDLGTEWEKAEGVETFREAFGDLTSRQLMGLEPAEVIKRVAFVGGDEELGAVQVIRTCFPIISLLNVFCYQASRL